MAALAMGTWQPWRLELLKSPSLRMSETTMEPLSGKMLRIWSPYPEWYPRYGTPSVQWTWKPSCIHVFSSDPETSPNGVAMVRLPHRSGEQPSACTPGLVAAIRKKDTHSSKSKLARDIETTTAAATTIIITIGDHGEWRKIGRASCRERVS